MGLLNSEMLDGRGKLQKPCFVTPTGSGVRGGLGSRGDWGKRQPLGTQKRPLVGGRFCVGKGEELGSSPFAFLSIAGTESSNH